MKCIIFICITFALLFSACGGSQPAPTTTTTSVPTKTSIPTSTETPIPTVPMIEIDGMRVPDPKVSNPELFDLENPDSPVVRFANAFEIRPEEIGDLKPELKTGVDGRQYVFLVTENVKATAEYDETAIPLLFASKNDKGKWIWKDVWTRDMADMQNLIFEAPPRETDHNFERFANQVMLNGDIDNTIVFRHFTTEDWKRIIDNWPDIKRQLDAGKVPKGFVYYWDFANGAFDYANMHGMTVRAANLVHGFDVPDPVYYGEFSKKDIKILLEFMVKTRVLQYNGVADPDDPVKDPKRVIHQLNIGEEWAATYLYGADKWPFWMDNIGFPQGIADISRWVSEANPRVIQVIAEDGILHMPPEDNRWKVEFYNLLSFIKDNNIPVKIVDIEDNFIVSNPPDRDAMLAEAKRIREMGFELTSETTVVAGDQNAVWLYTPGVMPEDPVYEQARIYGDDLEVHLQLMGPEGGQYGIGNFSDASEWYDDTGHPNANSSLLDNNHMPKPAFYKILQVLYSNIP